MSRKRFQFYLILSLSAHLIFYGFLFFMQHWQPQDSPSEKIDVAFLSPEELEKLRAADIKQQIVDQDEKPMNDEEPDEAKYLSAHNQQVKKQTVAQNKGEFKNLKQKQVSTAQKAPSISQTPPPAPTQKFDPLADMDRRFKAKQMENIGKNPEERQIEKPASTAASDLSQTPDYLN